MKEEDRKSMITLHRDKAHHMLEQADLMMTMGQWDLAVNRYYYACFHCLQALFVSKGLSALIISHALWDAAAFVVFPF